MTYAETTTAPASRALDVLIAERVMGLRVEHNWPCDQGRLGPFPWPRRTSALHGEQSDGEPDYLESVYRDDTGELLVAPHYSTDDAAAVAVIRRMAELGWKVTTRTDLTQPEPFTCTCYHDQRTEIGGADTFALAVARAAAAAFAESD